MFVRKIIPAALGLWVGVASGTGRAQEVPAVSLPAAVVPEPAQLVLPPVDSAAIGSLNQRMADGIAERLQRSGRLRGYRIDVAFADGLVELSGTVADGAQRDEVLRLVQGIPGVTRVRNLLVAERADVVLTAQGPKLELGPVPEKVGPLDKKAVGDDKRAPDKAASPAPFGDGMPQEPLSIMPMMPGVNPAMANPSVQPPPMPPYAWPTYAPYNNYSRVAYPNLYPYEAFPFVGPMYPFPKIPLGWRAVTLRWQDGHWWYGREATGHDWWRIRYF